jgi:GST-like protein
MADAPEKIPALPEGYVPPKVWQWEKPSGGAFASINRPIAGPTHDKELPVGEHALQLYSLGTPNGQKATIMLEELLQAGKPAEYDAWYIDIGEGDQFGSGFVEVNPNSKIPALLDRTNPDKPQRVFESGSILVYLAEKYDAFLPKDPAKRTEALNWLFWQMGSAPFVGGGFGHFYVYAPIKIEYAIDRYAMEAKRQFDVLDRHLAENRYLAGDEYSIADMAVWPWYGAIALGQSYAGGAEFLATHEYKNFMRWTEEVAARPGVQRGRRVNRKVENDPSFIRERHSAADLD